MTTRRQFLQLVGAAIVASAVPVGFDVAQKELAYARIVEITREYYLPRLAEIVFNQNNLFGHIYIQPILIFFNCYNRYFGFQASLVRPTPTSIRRHETIDILNRYSFANLRGFVQSL